VIGSQTHSGGLDPSLDLAVVAGLADSRAYETFNVWLVDGQRRLGVNMHLYFVRGGLARERAALFLPDGRTFVSLTEGAYDRPEAPGGGSLRYHCIEPFERWRYCWDGAAVGLTEAQEARGWVGDDGPTSDITVDLTAQTLSDPWLHQLSTGQGNPTGRPRTEGGVLLGKYEQLLAGAGRVAVNDEQWEFSGVGVRDHMRGPRNMGGMGSHAWLSGQLPDGRGFGMKQILSDSGQLVFSGAYVAGGGQIEPAEILQWPPFVRDAGARKFFLELRCGDRRICIDGENFHTTWIPTGQWGRSAAAGLSQGVFGAGHGLAREAKIIMSQSCARFIWDGVEGFGMCELSG
jgi:hypothetical protein